MIDYSNMTVHKRCKVIGYNSMIVHKRRCKESGCKDKGVYLDSSLKLLRYAYLGNRQLAEPAHENSADKVSKVPDKVNHENKVCVGVEFQGIKCLVTGDIVNAHLATLTVVILSII